MKKIAYKFFALIITGVIIVTSCTDGYEDLNVNPNEPTSVPTSYLLTNAQRSIMDDMWDEWWNGRFGLQYSQYWSQVVYTEEGRYQPRVNITNSYWNFFYTDMTDLVEIIKLNTDEETKGLAAATGSNNNQIAVARILKAFTFHMMTDVWGDIPYFEAHMGAENIHPVYTPQEEIYTDLLKELTEAQAQIELDQDGVEGDIIYDGDMAKWKKFANSLRMRIAMRTSKVSSDYKAEIEAAITAGVFESHEDDAKFIFESGEPSFNPLYENYFIDNRTDFAVSKPLIDRMNTLGDPRIGFYADLPVNGDSYVGMPYGMANDDATATSGESGANVSLPNATHVIAAQSPAILMNYAEVCFIKAELNGSDQSEYEKGVKASCLSWGVTEEDADAYISTLPAASPETIGTQKWLAMYPQGLQGWFEWRRTGFPNLEGPDGGSLEADLGGRIMPSRRQYPTDEQVLNEDQYAAAVASQGMDALKTRVWWDK